MGLSREPGPALNSSSAGTMYNQINMCAASREHDRKRKAPRNNALKIRMLVPSHPMPSPAMLRPKKNRRLIANETKPISVINSGDKTLKKFQLTAPTSSARSIRHILAPIDRSARSIVIKTFAIADRR